MIRTLTTIILVGFSITAFTQTGYDSIKNPNLYRSNELGVSQERDHVEFIWSNCDENYICNLKISLIAKNEYFEWERVQRFSDQGYWAANFNSEYEEGWVWGDNYTPYSHNNCLVLGDRGFLSIRPPERFECSRTLQRYATYLRIDQVSSNEELLEAMLFSTLGDRWQEAKDDYAAIGCVLYSVRALPNVTTYLGLNTPIPQSGAAPLTTLAKITDYNLFNWKSSAIDSETRSGVNYAGIRSVSTHSYLKVSIDGRPATQELGINLTMNEIDRRRSALAFIQEQCPGQTTRF